MSKKEKGKKLWSLVLDKAGGDGGVGYRERQILFLERGTKKGRK